MVNETLASLGERESLRRTVSKLKPGSYTLLGSGDDAAVVRAEGNFLVSTDTLNENKDFSTTWSTGFDVGYKAIASNLADIAAMGAIPTALVVALVVPGSTPITWLEEFASGMQTAIDELAIGAAVVGGDLAAGDQIVVAVTVHGQAKNWITRSGAKPGDRIAIAGTLGKAACGLAILQTGKPDLIRSYDDWVEAQLRPRPPIAAGIEANLAGASSMLDVSDGLLLDLERLAESSGCTMALDASELKGFEATLDLPAQALGISTESLVLYGGEDHALLATFPEHSQIPKAFKVIGEVRAGKAQVLLDNREVLVKGWDSVRGETI